MKTLTELCTAKIISSFSIFKEQLHLLPDDLREDIEKESFENKYQMIGGKVYPRNPVIIAGCDWGNYKS